jgi:UTP--glucose-1-phosphate uridylyltransferase
VLVKKIKKAVIPAAGYGTRFLPITKAMPKEMIPVVHKPVIHYVVEEAYHSGIRDILVITGKGKRAIEDYFDLDQLPVENDHIEELYRMMNDLNIFFVRQREVKGLGNAVSYAEAFMDDEPFAVLLGDRITIPPCTGEMISVFEKVRKPVIALEKVRKEDIHKFGIISTSDDTTKDAFIIEGFVEKPAPEDAPSNLAISGSYILTSEIFDCIRDVKPDNKGEIQLTDALNLLVGKVNIFGYIYRGKRYDIGNKLDWLKSNIELSLSDEEFGSEISEYISGLHITR